MGRTTKMEQVNFVVPPALLKAIRKDAARQELSLAEWFRMAARNQLSTGGE
jgi:predicted HicB family RNase H-like nuclease